MAREFFCAYHSMLDDMEALSDAEKGRLFTACLIYSKTGEAPQLGGNERILFPSFRSQIDRDNEKYKSKCEQMQANASRSKQTLPNRPQGKGKEEGEGKEKGDFFNPPNPLSAVMSAYMGKVNPTPSQMSMEELKGYVESMGADVCLRAIDIALDAKKANWNYIRAILRDKKKQGVKCIADWDALDAKFEKQRGNGNGVTQHELPDL